MIGVADRLVADGHTLSGVYSFPCDQVFNFNDKIMDMAAYHAVPFIQTPITVHDIAAHIDDGVTCFLSLGYPFKIPTIDEGKAYGINMHPSYLPKARGLMPTPTILMHEPEAAGVTIHKITSHFDAGDILAQKRVAISNTDTVDTYSAKIALIVPDMMSAMCADLPAVWQNAVPQDESQATYAPMPDDALRTLDFNRDDVDTIDAKGRAFGRYGVLAQVNGACVTITEYAVWKDKHDIDFGTCVLSSPAQMVVAVKGGYMMILKNT